MDSQRRWISYDTFKLIVAILLLLLILFLWLQRPAVSPPAGAGQATEVGAVAPTQTSLSTTDTVAPPTATVPPQPSSTPTTVQPTATPTSQPTPAATAIPPTATATTAAQPEPTATPQAAPTAAQPAPSTAADCPLAQPSRLAIGNKALVTAKLNLRQEAGMDKQIIRVGLPNTTVEITGGPVCGPYQQGAYLWWNIKYPDGMTGWSAEASLSDNFYFLQPVP